MALVNCSVLCRTTNNLLYPWKILTVLPGITVGQFFKECIRPEINKENLDLDGAFLGRSKDSLDRVELVVPLDTAVQCFGAFLPYYNNNQLTMLRC